MGLATAPLVARYVLTDQPYVARLVEQNIAQNDHGLTTTTPRARARPTPSPSTSGRGKGKPPASSCPPTTAGSGGAGGDAHGRLAFRPLDWELDVPTRDLAVPDLVVACDCIYNEALIQPLVQTCADACRLGSASDDAGGEQGRRPCVCVVAQQLRDPEIFEGWLREFTRAGFRVWRVPDQELPEGLRSSSGFVVHVGILREAWEEP